MQREQITSSVAPGAFLCPDPETYCTTRFYAYWGIVGGILVVISARSTEQAKWRLNYLEARGLHVITESIKSILSVKRHIRLLDETRVRNQSLITKEKLKYVGKLLHPSPSITEGYVKTRQRVILFASWGYVFFVKERSLFYQRTVVGLLNW